MEQLQQQRSNEFSPVLKHNCTLQLIEHKCSKFKVIVSFLIAFLTTLIFRQ